MIATRRGQSSEEERDLAAVFEHTFEHNTRVQLHSHWRAADLAEEAGGIACGRSAVFHVCDRGGEEVGVYAEASVSCKSAGEGGSDNCCFGNLCSGWRVTMDMRLKLLCCAG